MQLSYVPEDSVITEVPVPEVPIIPRYVAHAEPGLRSVVGVTCCLSILGSVFIILSYLLFPGLRTNARLILLHLSLADFGVAASNLFGIAFRFERFYVPPKNGSTIPVDILTPSSVNNLCKAEAFIAHFSTISSMLWTMALAAFMYNVSIVNSKRPNDPDDKERNKWFMRSCYVICYGLAFF